MASQQDFVNGNINKKIGTRHVQTALMFFCLTFGYGMRVTMSMAVVAMTDKSNSQVNEIMVFDWPKRIQDIISSAFYWGYTCMQIPGGHVAHKYGAKFLLVNALFVNGIVGFAIPHAAYWFGWKAVCACRVIQGLTQGVFLPSLHTLLGKWAPPEERGRLSAYVYGGSQIGTIVVMTLSGFLAASSYGWPSIFYSWGAICILWAIVWHIFGSESPSEHRRISTEEKMYIQTSLGQNDNKKKLKVPWGNILKSVPVWAIAFAHIGSSYLHVTLFTEAPSYLNKIMGVDYKANGILSSLPFIGMWLSSLSVGYFSDMLINNNTLSLTAARKITNTIGMWGCALGFVILGFIPSNNITVAMVVLVFAATMKGFTYVGFHVNHLDITPNFSGTLMSISNTCGNGVGALAPLAAGLILKDEHDPTQWRTVFCVLAGIVFLSNVFYIIFGSAQKAEWNEPNYFIEKSHTGHKDESEKINIGDENRNN